MTRSWCNRALGLVVMCGIAGTSLPARADTDTPPDPVAVEAARADFAEGQGHFRSKRWPEALKAFERSYAQVPSPNAELMVARCLRELGRGADSAAAYTVAETEARNRVTKGEAKYGETADAAANEGKALRQTLGTMKIHVVHPGGATLMVDKKNVALSKEGDATILHDPGSVQVIVRDTAGVEQKQTATVVAGNTAAMEFTVAETHPGPVGATQGTPDPNPDHTTEHDGESGGLPGWFWPATIASGVVTLGGAAAGFGFGAQSKNTFDELVSKCGPNSCGSAQRAAADDGKQKQLFANVGFGVAIAGVVATAVILYLGLTSDHKR
jgi:hypothetical protein